MSVDRRAEAYQALQNYRAAIEAQIARMKGKNGIADFKPYAKQLEFYKKGKTDRERLLMAANQVGKTFCGSREVGYHLTGDYPDWWPGHRFGRPIAAWAASETGEVTRDTCQKNIVGEPADREAWGTEAIPGDLILETRMKRGTPDAIDTLVVRHVPTGGQSILGFKSYDQGRKKFQGSKRDLVWLDEEPDEDIYSEALTRTNAVPDGRLLLTFTPLQGISEVVRGYLDAERAAKLVAEGRSEADVMAAMMDEERKRNAAA